MSLAGYSPGTSTGLVTGSGTDALDCDVRVEVTLTGGRVELSFAARLAGRDDAMLVADLARPEAVRVRREIERALQASRPVPTVPLGSFPGTYATDGASPRTVAVDLSLRSEGERVSLVASCERDERGELTIESRLDRDAGVALNRHVERIVRNL